MIRTAARWVRPISGAWPDPPSPQAGPMPSWGRSPPSRLAPSPTSPPSAPSPTMLQRGVRIQWSAKVLWPMGRDGAAGADTPGPRDHPQTRGSLIWLQHDAAVPATPRTSG